MRRFLPGLAFLCILSTTPIVLSQLATTSLSGTVKDPSGALVPGANVKLLNASNGIILNASTDRAGLYVFAQIPPARYTITVSATGFGDQVKSAELLVNQPATINFTLTIQSSAVTVDVSAAAQTLNTTDATLGSSVANSTIQALPMEGRDPLAWLTSNPESSTLETLTKTMPWTAAAVQ